MAKTKLFNPGVARRSEELRDILLRLDKLVADMEARKTLVSFGKKYPQEFSEAIAELKEARKLTYRVIERLNWPTESGK